MAIALRMGHLKRETEDDGHSDLGREIIESDEWGTVGCGELLSFLLSGTKSRKVPEPVVAAF